MMMACAVPPARQEVVDEAVEPIVVPTQKRPVVGGNDDQDRPLARAPRSGTAKIDFHHRLEHRVLAAVRGEEADGRLQLLAVGA